MRAPLLLIFVSLSLAAGIHIPITNSGHSLLRARSVGVGAIGLGDFKDISYNVLVKIGIVIAPVILDTGSADLWMLLDSCPNNCSRGLPVYPHKSIKYSGVDARLFYGDSTTGTYAFGPIAKDTVTVANLSLPNQYFAGINQTDTNVSVTGSVGILGLGFPVNSVIWNALFNHQYPARTTTTSTRSSPTSSQSPRSTSLVVREDHNKPMHASRVLPNVALAAMQSLATVEQLLNTFVTNGPVIARMALSGLLSEPSFTVTLQRDTLDIGGNIGMLSLGELPETVQNDSLVWVPVRLYTTDQGGIPASPAAPNETYPISWEVPITGVYLDGQQLPMSTLSTGVSLSALIDTGSSLIRGPSDVVASIYKQISHSSDLNSYPCATAHVLEFEIGGRLFRIDPLDFGWQAVENDVQTCNSSIVPTDPPSKGFLYAWSLGVPFLKSVLASFHYGNLTHPSIDPPRVGFISTVPPNFEDIFSAAIKSAHKNFPAIVQTPPQGIPNTTLTGSAGVELAPTPTSLSTISTFTDSSASTNPASSSLSPSQFTTTVSHNGARSISQNTFPCILFFSSVLIRLFI